MIPNEEIQAGESQPAETPVEPVVEETPTTEVSEEAKTEPLFEDAPSVMPVAEASDIAEKPAKKSFWDKILPWVIVAVVFFIGGLATIFFTLYQPAKEAATAAAEKATQQISSLTTDFDKAKSDLSGVQAELDSVKTELTTANATIDEKTAELAKTNQLKTVYKFIADVNAARAVLERLDVDSSRQAINFAKADLADLEATGIDANSIAGFASLLDEADKKLSESDLLKSRELLNTLQNNLQFLINNLL